MTEQTFPRISDKAILDFMLAFQNEHGYPPSLKEICKGTGFKSTSHIYHRLQILVADGLLRHEGGRKARAYVAKPW